MTDASGETRHAYDAGVDGDVLNAARAIAQQQHRSVGAVLSDLARRALHRSQPPMMRNRIPLLPRRDSRAVVTLDTVDALRDEGP